MKAIYSARLSPDGARVLCGRPFPGRGFCGGQVGYVWRGEPFPQVGAKEDPPGSRNWIPGKPPKRLTFRSEPLRTGALKPPRRSGGFGQAHGAAAWIDLAPPARPWLYPCPICSDLARVDSTLLGFDTASEQPAQ